MVYDPESVQRSYGFTYGLSTGERLGLSDLTTMNDDKLLSELKPIIKNF